MSGDNKTTEDNRLKNWLKWTQEWKTAQKRFTEKLNLESGDLLMNYSNDWKNVSDEKYVLDLAKIPTEFDKYRGKPDFYKLPLSLPKRFPCEPTYFAVKTKEETFTVPEVELVGIPEEISRRDKNILNSTRNIYRKWQNCNYRQLQMDRFFKQIQAIVPHWPDFQHLIVIGRKIGNEESKPINLSPKQSIKSEKSATETPKKVISEKTIVPTLKIDGILVENEVSPIKIHKFFEYDLMTETGLTKTISFENLGLKTLRIEWNKIEPFRFFQSGLKESNFFFDKRELILLPGQVVTVPIFFKSESQSNFFELWEITFAPNIETKILLSLESHCYYKNLKTKVDAILEYIDHKTKVFLIKDILYEMFQELGYRESYVKSCCYTERHLFEMNNLYNNHPVYLFDSALVQQLKMLYEKIKIDNSNWNYSIRDLEKLAIRCDISIFQQEFLYDSQLILGDIMKQFDTPVRTNKNREKYFVCYQILDAHFVQMCHMLEKVESKYSPFKSKLIPNENQPDRLIYETFEEDYVQISESQEIYDFEMKPKPEFLKDIDDIEKMYALYFNKTIPAMKETKKPDKKEKKTDKKKKEKVVKKEKVEEKIVEVTPTFDPFIEKFHYEPEIFEYNNDIVEATVLTKEKIEDLFYKRYLVVYSCLQCAIEGIVDAIESFDCEFSYDTLNLIREQFKEE